ncbi:DUF11 domain-containing protein [Candidatus Woesearchaeota archaeon]|nr:DUF11 domain-containing protein [Candidatus Woesearchaeota archaeon]MBW3006422.1 DUF11 domain-containing protein [Candidatus Woesearchaeota archaeon]
MKKFIQKNLPFLSILIIAALFLAPAILATDGWTGFGAVDSWTGFGAVDSWTGIGAVDGWTSFGAADGWTGLSGGTQITDSEEETEQPEETEEDEGYDPFDPVFDQDPLPPTGGTEIPPLDDAFEATIDLSLSDSPDPVQPGDELIYTITYYNRGNGDARDIIITMDADSYTPIQSSEPSATTGNDEWRIEEVEAHTGGEITVTTKVKDKAEDGQTLENTVSIQYYDPVYGIKETSEIEYTQVKEISEDTGDGSDTRDADEIGIKVLSTRFPIQSGIGEPLMISLRIENDGTENLEDVKISVVSQDLGIRTSAGPFDLDSNDDITKTLLMDIPADTPEGNYFLRFTITSNGNTRRTIYRDIDLVSTLE